MNRTPIQVSTPGRFPRIVGGGPLTVWLAVFIIGHSPTLGQSWQREKISFEAVEKRAKDLADSDYVPTDADNLPDWLKNLGYDQYRAIRFRNEHELWAAENLPFRCVFFHPGYIFKEPVQLNEFTSTHTQRIRLSESYFEYGDLVGERGDLPVEAGFSGFRLYTPYVADEGFGEVAAFQGASYWRALGKGQRYGISARGIAIDTAMEGVQEEFPGFREFWLGKPEPGDPTLSVLALMDGPSVTGAYEFRIRPGQETAFDVTAVLFARREVRRVGIAPMSSMFWFGENSRRRFDDFRPEVHDSDGLLIHSGDGNRIWRPLSNDSPAVETSVFRMERCEGFGLLQRDRDHHRYEDEEAAYRLRPSLWIEPTSDWGPGSVILIEIPTHHETSDNIVAMWEPENVFVPGERLEFRYRQKWTTQADPTGSEAGRVVATRTGVHDWQPEQRGMYIEFLDASSDAYDGQRPEAVVETTGSSAGKVLIEGVTVEPMQGDRWRVSFQLLPVREGQSLGEVGPVELLCHLKREENKISETWAYRIAP